MLRKIRRTADFNEKNELCDKLINRYEHSADDRAIYAVIQAFNQKAKAARDDEAKLQIYSTLIERYKDNRDYSVKNAIDEAIAAKFRLEMR